MFDEEEHPRRAPRFVPLSLDGLGVEELESYIASLREEIARAEAEIGRKRAVRDAAAAFFKR